MPTTPNHDLPYPDTTDQPNGPGQIQALAEATDTALETVKDDLTLVTDALDGRVDKIEAVPVVNVFTANGTWNKPANARILWIRMVGGGGAGGGAASTPAGQVAAGGGGSGGTYAEKWMSAALAGASETVTPGAGGTGVSGGTGNDGGTSSFGAHLTAGGGKAGVGAAASSSVPSAAAGGDSVSAATGQNYTVTGDAGQWGLRLQTGTAISGAGGGSHLGGGAAGVSGSQNGVSGKAHGGGGSGGVNGSGQGVGRAGGNGANGVVIVVTFF